MKFRAETNSLPDHYNYIQSLAFTKSLEISIHITYLYLGSIYKVASSKRNGDGHYSIQMAFRNGQVLKGKTVRITNYFVIFCQDR